MRCQICNEPINDERDTCEDCDKAVFEAYLDNDIEIDWEE